METSVHSSSDALDFADRKNKAKDGSFYWVDTSIVPFTHASGIPYQFVSIRFDITEKKYNQELAHNRVKVVNVLAGIKTLRII